MNRRARACGVRTPDAWSGFSLIEVLIVLGLIAFLTAAIVVIMPRVANAAKIAATRATIKKADEVVNDRLNGFRRYLTTQDTLAGNATPSYVDSASLQAANGNLGVAKVLAIKKLMQANFPQILAEVPLPSWQGSSNYSVGALIHVPSPSSANTVLTFRCSIAPTSAAGKSGGSQPSWPTTPGQTVTDNNLTWQLVPIDPLTESAACLYLIMTQSSVFDTEAPAAAELKGVEAVDSDGDGLQEVVDAWGHPVRYYRWPTRLVRPGTTANYQSPGWYNILAGPGPTPVSILIRSAPRGPAAQWSANTPYAAGALVQPATITQNNVPNLMLYDCTTAGTSAGSEPNPWNASGGATTSDGSAAWQAALDPLAVDSDDPNGLANANQVGESTLPSTSPQSTFHTWSTYHVTLIVSCGSDDNTSLGLYEPNDTANFGNLAQPKLDGSGNPLLDPLYKDITNHQQ